ncbi:MAG: tetratricopeptide repeat protein [Rhodothermaceae bacterium]|nr:tetratricopeptide repeat protein [Rhodothermaceae bacterium]
MSALGSSSGTPPATAIEAAARCLASGQVAEATQRLEALVAAVPAYPAAHVLLAKAYEANGQWEAALDIWHRAHVLVPNSPLVRRERQRLLDAQVRSTAASPLEPEATPDAPSALVAEETSPLELSTAEAVETLDEAVEMPDEAAAAAPDIDEHPETEATDSGHDGSSVIAPEAPRPIEEDSPSDAEDETEFTASSMEQVTAPPEVVDDAPLLPPLPSDIPAEPVDALSSEDAAWWKEEEASEHAPDAPDEDGWTILEETATAPDDAGVTEARIEPPGETAGPPPPSSTPEVEDARILDDVAPGEPAEGPETDEPEGDDLDSLIQSLEDAPRIRPDPLFDGPEPAFDEGIADDMVSETLARIYAAQHQYAEAAIVYEKLAAQRPAEADTLLERAAELRAQADGK